MPKTRSKYIDELLHDLGSIATTRDSASKLRNTIDKIGNLADKKATPRLLPFLKHETDYVRASVVSALAKIRGRSISPQLVSMLAREQNPIVKLAIIDALGVLEDRTALPALQAIKQDPDQDDKTKIGAIFSIDRLTEGEQSAVDQLVEYLIDSRHPHTRVEAAKALGKLGDPRAITPLIAALDDDRVFVRKKVIEALVSFGDKRVIDPVIECFKDERVFIEREFINVLWTFPGYEGKELWEIIAARNEEKLDAFPSMPAKKPGDHVDECGITAEYAYETLASTGSGPAGNANTNGENRAPASTRAAEHQEETPGTSIEESISRAKLEKVPGKAKVPASNDTTRAAGDECIDTDDLAVFGRHFTNGERAHRKKQYHDALVQFKLALAAKPDAWQAWYNMGLIFYDVDEREKSIQCFEESLRHKPNEIDTMLNLASLHAEAGEYPAAAEWFIAAVSRDERLTDAWLMLGKVLHRLRADDLALFCFTQVLQHGKDKRERGTARKASETILKTKKDIVARDPRKEPLPEPPQSSLKLDL